MTSNKALQAGQEVGERCVAAAGQADAPPVGEGRSMLNFSEVTYAGDWSLRSALCRLAQPEPVRVGRVLESVRRLGAALTHTQKSTTSDCDLWPAELARLIESGLDADSVLAGYGDVDGIEPLTVEDQAALPLLAVAARFEKLSELMATWANQGPGNRPIEAFDEACDEIETRLDELGVPREAGEAPRGARSRR